MLNLSFNILWNIFFFGSFFYVTTVFTLILFVVPSLKLIIFTTAFKSSAPFEYVSGFDTYKILLSFSALFLFPIFEWSSYTISSWFGHLIFASFQFKIIYLISFFFYLIILIYCNSFYFSSKEIYDYLIVNLSFFLWAVVLFLSNTLFTIIFLIEILSTLIFLLIITSTFSSTHYYNNLNLNLNYYFNNSLPFFFLQTIMFFFWVSLIASLNLFFSLLIFYLNFLTFDWFFIEYVFSYLILITVKKNIFFFLFIWFNFIFCVFLKCGLVPFYFWKPVFFKGMPLNSFFFYITFFYFFIFLFFINFFLIYLTEIFFFFLIINILILMLGLVVILFILTEAFYLKTFLALSSILNTLFIFLALNAGSSFDFFFHL